MICVHFRFASLALNSSCSHVDFSPACTPLANINRSSCVHELLFYSLRLLSSSPSPSPPPPPPSLSLSLSLFLFIITTRIMKLCRFGPGNYSGRGGDCGSGKQFRERLNFTGEEITPGSIVFFQNPFGHTPEIIIIIIIKGQQRVTKSLGRSRDY